MPAQVQTERRPPTRASVELTKDEEDILNEFKVGGDVALAGYFVTLHTELNQLLRSRIDQRLRRRLDVSDIIQEAYIEACHRLSAYLDNPQIPPSAWIRRLVRQVLFKVQREHLETKCRDLRREFHANEQAVRVDVCELSARTAPPDTLAQQGETREKLAEILSSMPLLESEILTLVYFESHSIRQAATELNIGIEAAKKRYRRAIVRLRGWMGNASRMV